MQIQGYELINNIDVLFAKKIIICGGGRLITLKVL